MATVTTTTSYLIPISLMMPSIQALEPLFSKLESIQGATLGTFDLVGAPVKQGFLYKNPRLNATKTDLAAYLNALTGQTITALSISDFRFARDATFVEIIIF